MMSPLDRFVSVFGIAEYIHSSFSSSSASSGIVGSSPLAAYAIITFRTAISSCSLYEGML